MAGWRQAVALAMSGEEIEASTALSRSWTEPAGRVSRAAMLLSAIGKKPSFFAVGRRLGVHHHRDGAMPRRASHGLWRACGTWMTDRDLGKEPTIHAGGQGLACIFGLRQGQGATAKRMNCGRHGFWPAMRESADRRRVTNVSPVWLKAPCASFSVKRKSSRQGALPSGTPRRRVRAQDGGSSVCLPRGPGPEKSRCQGGEIGRRSRSRSSLTTRSLESRPDRHDGTGFAASARPPCELRAGS